MYTYFPRRASFNQAEYFGTQAIGHFVLKGKERSSLSRFVSIRIGFPHQRSHFFSFQQLEFMAEVAEVFVTHVDVRFLERPREID